MNDELVLFGTGLDLASPEDDNFWMDRVEEVLEKAFREHDAEYALNACANLINIAKISGKALARMLYTLKTHWDVFDTLETFEDYAYPKLGLDPHTVTRYIKVEEMLRSLPEGVDPNLTQRPIGQLIPIANAVAQGYEFDSEDWKRFSQAPTEREIRKEILDITGKEPRKSGVTIYMDKSGSLWAQNVDERKFIGSLEVQDDDPLIRKAINRIVDRTGVMTQ